LVKSLFPFQKLFGLTKVVVSTYQSISGMGQSGLEMFDDEKEFSRKDSPLSKNFTPFIGSIEEEGYCQEEWKIINESRRILDFPKLAIYPSTIRVPIKVCHGESVYVETKNPINRIDLEKEISESSFLTYCDDPEKLINTTNNTQVHIGRLRFIDKFSAQFWSTADNLLVGSAWNAFQIIESLERLD
jgi:aspartate-semialdehyde dehydrogenase